MPSDPSEHGDVHCAQAPPWNLAASISWRSLYISHESLVDDATRTSSTGPAPGRIVTPDGWKASTPTGEVRIWNAGAEPEPSKTKMWTKLPDVATAAGASPGVT